MPVAKKKKHVSKKNKKAWRKHCDITDVEEFLDDQRLGERIGRFETKPDSEIFVVDTAGGIEDLDQKPLSAKLRKRAKLTEAPKCFAILQSSSQVQDPQKKRNKVNPVGFKPTALSRLSEKRAAEKGLFEKKVEIARKNRKIAIEKKRKAKQSRQTFNSDIWNEELQESKYTSGIPSTLQDDFISIEAVEHNVLPEKRLRQKPPLANTVVTRAAVEVPHPGMSYNPAYEDHQNLLQAVVTHEQKNIKQEAHLHRVTTGLFSKVTMEQKENQWREEMSTGLPQPHNPSNDPSDSDSEYKSINPPTKNKKKDHKSRRKQKEQILEREQLKRKKIDKQKITDLYKLRKIQSTLNKNEKLQAEVRSKKAKKRTVEAEKAMPALNAHKPKPKEPDFVDPAQLTGDLRQVTAKTNLLRDRYEALQHRGALAQSKLMMIKKRKVKSYFKSGHKVTDKDIEKYLSNSMK